MHKRLAVVVAIVAASLTSPLRSQTPDPLDDLFRRTRAVQASLKTLRAAFTETTVSTLLRDPVVATGTLTATMPLRVVMQYRTPAAKIVALDDRRLVVAWPDRPQREELDITAMQRRVQKYFVEVSPRELRESFVVTLTSDRGTGTYRLEMVPKRKQIAEGLSRLDVWVDRSSLAMTKMTLKYPSGDSKTLELRDVSINSTVDESTFALLRRPGR